MTLLNGQNRALVLVSLAVSVVATPVQSAPEAIGEWSGFAGLELRAFTSSAAFPDQRDDVVGSLVLEPEYFREWNDGQDRFVMRPFARLDSADDERTHFDFRELYWQRVGKGFEFDVGIRKVFWGVAESNHLVDIINQTDGVEDLDGEDKLGQPMLHWGLVRSWGFLELFLLPGFRDRTFAGVDGRLRPEPTITDEARYESSAAEGHLDFAVRWSHVVGDVDLGLAYFRGTSREPVLVTAKDDSRISLIPFYGQIDQLSLDLQATREAWLWKLEAISRWSASETAESPGFGDYLAAVGGFEYTFFDVGGRGLDVGLLVEYLWDERGERASTAFEDDVFVASRLALNDVQSTELLVGAAIDVSSGAAFVNVEGSRRLGDRFELELRLRIFSGVEAPDPLLAFARDDYLQLSIKRFF